MDNYDKAILKILQDDATTPLAQIAAKVKLSTTPCWRRIEKMKKAGLIRKQVVLLDPQKINLGATVFVGIRTNQHNSAWLDRFAKGVKEIPEVLEIYRMSGEVDYLLKIVVPDLAGYDAVYKKLIKVADLYDVSSSFAMEQMKFTTSLPLEHLK